MPLPNFILVVRSALEIDKKYFLRRSHKVTLVGGVNRGLIAFSNYDCLVVALKTISRKLFGVYIFHFGCFRVNKTYFSLNSACF